MSDKFLVETSKPAVVESYSARRSAQQLKSLRAGQAKQVPTLKQREEEQRRAGLSTSLFETHDQGQGSHAREGGPAKAMELMMKMGWKVGEGLGKKRSPSPPLATKRPKPNAEPDDEDEEGAPRGGIGSSSRAKSRTEPIRVSMWAGRKGLSARSPSPPPLPAFGQDPDSLDPRKMARLDGEAESFRERQRRDFAGREVERKGGKARDVLVQFDRDKGVKVSRPQRLYSPLASRGSGPVLLRLCTKISSSSTLYTSFPPTH